MMKYLIIGLYIYYIKFTPCRDVDYDEMAWELEKCLTYHFIAQMSGKSQMIMNEEATMARRGLGRQFSNKVTHVIFVPMV